jgi:lipoyl(octanoyl) transferase
MKLNVCKLGNISYSNALEIQNTLQKKRQNGEILNTLLLLEHPAVITLGTRGDYKNIYLPTELLREQGVEIFEVGRGGDVTYHGPGQIVGYPIIDLNDFDKTIRTFIYKIENTIMRLLKDKFDITATSMTDKFTGVWVDDKKIAAIGISVKKWVTMHGFAFNVNTNLEHFNWINPCGLSKGVTSVEQLTGKPADMARMYDLVAEYFASELESEIVEVEIGALI